MERGDEIEQRLAFLDIRAEDIELLRGLRPMFEKNADDFVAAFYRHLLAFAPTRQLLRDPAVKERLLLEQRAYLLSLPGPTIDQTYLEDRRRMGEAHERVGLEPRWFLGAYSIYFSLLVPLICQDFEGDVEGASRAVMALQKLLTFDEQIAMEAYISRREMDLEYMADELAREGRRLAHDFQAQGATLRLTTERARAAEELASIGTLVAGLAHEIGTPMGVIQGHAKLLESAVSDTDATWRLRTIREQITRISRIIQTLLNMARPRKSQRQPVALEPLLDDTVSFISEKLARRGIRIARDYDPVPSITGDAERLQQLFLNLFLNAADAMPEGGELRVTLGESDSGEAQVRVRDTGAGISEEQLERVFDPFYTTKAAGEGNGLGLMVCKGIVSDHRGQIEVASSAGAGTEFRILFPMAGALGGSPKGDGI